ncbi:Bug family tripartite tricarboxylate transporter substrate binding protein [Paracandidimonas soli]|uniref:Tripartite-type tricarboxylate transporter receptor subunit TctC n=1 Tax=Paracandidimonas soli TaxID=1917182 RepID=A0A4R3UUJ2_9BURK|nr:tripartite tricarboxylate transporter substrate binding protein [Paracandidimonas soli]TCU93704.1 tripartite-type tricarboxylate transporter receptor subunit TctC [Paracandidimonas soli]
MRFPNLLRYGVALSVCAAFSGTALAAEDAASYPSKPVTVIVPFSPGGGTDISARLLATHLGQLTGQTFVVDNRPGAAGQIAADAVARAPADGYTLLFGNSGLLSINPLLYKLQNDPAEAFEPVSTFSDLPFILVTSPKLQVDTLQDLIDLAKKEPGKHTFASSGTGGGPHLSGEIFQEASGTELLHVPYKGGGPAMTDLVAGHVDMLIASVLESVSFINAGQLKALAVTGSSRSSSLPNVPTLKEQGVDAEVGSWTAVLAPKGTPQPVVERLGDLIRQVTEIPEVKETLTAQGAGAMPSTPQGLADMMARDREKFGQVIKKRNLQVN